MIKLTEAQKTGTTTKDPTGRTVFQSSFLYRDLFINPEHIISINEEISSDSSMKLSRIETTRGSFVVVGTPNEIQKEFSSKKRVLKD
jgi:queuine/archaeosine tRNA-ribosyltransferase